jgi:hypothetical protein
MPTTTNFGWTTPADTDLVKDGASAIRTLGSNIDTSLVDLKGGTSGQYLKKNSNTDLDYVWGDVSAGGQTLLSTTSLTGASVTISGISTSYNDLYVFIDDPYLNTAGTYLSVEPNATGSLADFRYMTWTSGSQGNFGVTAGNIEPAIDLAATSGVTRNGWLLKIYSYSNTTYGKNFEMVGRSSNADSVIILAGGIRTASAITSLKITTTAPGSRTFSGGQVRIYGVK